ncbi:uncharacterized protein Eint_080370 [Encephalitozoon intestinalis ATCC 50506]|uniref:Uncharacterized protein n=1 Tax=Encephalitozoon intestinalis (strain ATCC 50506) TaxID=876142 RepID=E0S8H9_ENCIT|nr:uncharacterized protein Eint_080370 [Encephalitozoon intestinalis ATCC 50506]ADM11973.2 hypothetical protein Eint_080370 [Encephalitozoon intestinalis ATCC 50506]UTX45758.1 hypothetical protein GPK93_08g13320 [Encephalitozoon intestinalis]
MNRKRTEGVERQKRYNEKEIVKKFLVSEKGIAFLVDHTNRTSSEEDVRLNEKLIRKEVDNLIDYYFAWIHGLPVRKSMNMNRYEFIKYLEEFCMKNDVSNLFEFLFI